MESGEAVAGASLVDDSTIENLQNTVVAKSLVWTDGDNHYYMLILDAMRRVDASKLAAVVPEKTLSIADREMAELITKQKVGTIGPFHHNSERLTIIVDENLILLDPAPSVLVGSGRPGFSYRVSSPASLVEICHAQVYPLTDMKAPPSARSRHFGGFSGKSNKSVDLMSYSIGSEHPSTKSDDSIFEYLEPSSMKSLESDLVDVASPKGATMCHRKDDKDFEEVVFSPQLLRKVAISSDTVKLLAVIDAAKRGRFHPQYHFPTDYSVADHLNLPSKVGGKTALHLATWKGALENVRVLLDHGAALNQWSTNEGNYGKTAIFYSITQARDDVVLLLLAYGARVTIINNKGQSPRSLGASHLQEATIQAIEEAEALQISSYFYQHQHQSQQQQQHAPIDNSLAFLNFYTPEYRNPQESCFGDLDPRFADEAIDLRASVHNDWKHLPRSLNPTAAGARRSTRSNQTFMYSHMFQESFLFPSNESTFPDDAAAALASSLSSSGVANEIVAEVSTNEVTLRGLIVSKRQVSQTLIFANLAPLGHSDFSSLKEVLYSWHRKQPSVASMEANGDGDDGPAATTTATATATPVEETFAVQLILGKSLRETYGESLLRELGKYLREGQRVEVVGEIRAISEAKRWSLFHSSNPDASTGSSSSSSDHAQYKDIDFAVQRIRIAPVTASSSSSSSTDDMLSAQARDELRWQEKLQELRGPSHVQLPTTTKTTGRNQNVLKTTTAGSIGGKPPVSTVGRDDGHSTVSEALLPPMPSSTVSAAEITIAPSPASSLVSRKAQRKLQLERYAAEQKARAMEIKAALSRGDVPFWSLALATQLLAHPNPAHFLESYTATDATTTMNRPMDLRDKEEEDDYKRNGVQPAIPALLVHDAASVELFLKQVRNDFIAAGQTSSSVNNNNDGRSSLLTSKQQPGQDEGGNETSEVDDFVSFNETEARQQWVPSTVYEYVVGIDCEWRPDGFYEKSPTQSPPMGDTSVHNNDLSPPTMDDADVFVIDNERHHMDPPPGTSKTSKIHFAASTSSLVGLEEAATSGTADNSAAVAPSGRKERGSSQRPSFVETLQLATRHRVYVLDMPSLYANIEWRSKANEALSILFGDERVWKIGYDCAQDFQRLAVSYPGIPAFQRVHSIVDLLPLSKWLYPDVVNRQNSGLSKLCYSLFHRTLNKEQQTSTWHLRPFTPQQLEYAALDAAILLVAFNQMAHDYHVHPVSVASQSHKRRLAQNVLSSPPQRSFRHYIETMGILYHVKFQIYHEDAWDPLLLSSPSSSSLSSSVVQSDGTTRRSTTPTTTTTANPLILLSRLQEILEIVDVRRKKHLQIQTQLTRHVAVLKYHRHYQDKEFPPLDKLIDMLLAPSTSPQSLSGSSSVVGSARVPVFTATTAVEGNIGSSSNEGNVGFPISASESSTPSLEFHKNMRSSKTTKKELRALKKSKKANQETEMKELDAKLRGIALHDLMSDNTEDDGESALPLPAPAEDVRQVTPKDIMIPASSNRLHLSLPEATLFPTTMSPPVPGNNVVTSHNGGDSTVLPVGVKEASSGPLNWLSTIGSYVGRNSEDCLHMIYRTLYLPRDPQLIKLSPNLLLHTSPSTRPPSSTSSTSTSPPPPKIERLGGYMFLMQESVLMFVNTLSDASGGSISSKPSSVSLSQMATMTMTSSKVSTTSTSFLSESMKYVNAVGINSNNSELNEFDDDGAAFTFVFPMGDLARLLGSSSPVLRGLKGASSPSAMAATTSQKATTTAAGGGRGGTEGVSTVKKRIFHLFVRERKKPYLYCGTCYPVKAIAVETNTPPDESEVAAAAAAATMAKVKFQLFYFQDGPQPLSLHEDYQRILLEHTMELTKRYAKEQLMSERASIHVPPMTTKHPPVHHGVVPVPVASSAAATVVHAAVANVHGHIKASEIDRPEHVHAANLPDRNQSIHGLKVPINDTVGVAFPEEEEEEMAFGDWSHSVKLSRHNSNAQKPPVVLPSEQSHSHVAKKHHVTVQENHDTRK